MKFSFVLNESVFEKNSVFEKKNFYYGPQEPCRQMAALSIIKGYHSSRRRVAPPPCRVEPKGLRVLRVVKCYTTLKNNHV